MTTAGTGILYKPGYRSDEFVSDWPSDWRRMEQWLPPSTWFMYAAAIGTGAAVAVRTAAPGTDTAPAQPARSRTFSIRATRSACVAASGVTFSVVTPDSRKAAIRSRT